MSVGERIREKRKELRLTTIEMGNILGVGASTVTNWETGIRNPSINMLSQLARVLGCTPNDLLGFETPEKPQETVQEIIARRMAEAREGSEG